MWHFQCIIMQSCNLPNNVNMASLNFIYLLLETLMCCPTSGVRYKWREISPEAKDDVHSFQIWPHAPPKLISSPIAEFWCMHFKRETVLHVHQQIERNFLMHIILNVRVKEPQYTDTSDNDVTFWYDYQITKLLILPNVRTVSLSTDDSYFKTMSVEWNYAVFIKRFASTQLKFQISANI